MKGQNMICQQFLLCKNEATTTRPAPLLVDGKTQFVDGKPHIVEIPACDRYAEKIDRINAMD